MSPETWTLIEDRPVGERKYDGFHGWDTVIVVAAVLVGLNLLGGVLSGPADPNETPAIDEAIIEGVTVFASLLSLGLFGGLPILWLAMTRVGGWSGAMVALRMDTGRRWFWFGISSFVTVGLIAAVFLFYVVMINFDVEGGDPIFTAIIENSGWITITLLALSAGVGEEIFFRGVLQRWIGVYGQAAVFGVGHINQGFAAALFITGIALVFGLLYRKGMPLWALMFAHFMYDFILLGAAKVGL